MKYFFLSEGWTTGRIWEFGGLWNEGVWQRKPHLQRMNLHITESNERLWLYQVEDGVLMVEVQPSSKQPRPIGQVVLKRLITAEQVIERLCSANTLVGTDDGNGLAVSADLDIANQEAD